MQSTCKYMQASGDASCIAANLRMSLRHVSPVQMMPVWTHCNPPLRLLAKHMLHKCAENPSVVWRLSMHTDEATAKTEIRTGRHTGLCHYTSSCTPDPQERHVVKGWMNEGSPES